LEKREEKKREMRAETTFLVLMALAAFMMLGALINAPPYLYASADI